MPDSTPPRVLTTFNAKDADDLRTGAAVLDGATQAELLKRLMLLEPAFRSLVFAVKQEVFPRPPSKQLRSTVVRVDAVFETLYGEPPPESATQGLGRLIVKP